MIGYVALSKKRVAKYGDLVGTDGTALCSLEFTTKRSRVQNNLSLYGPQSDLFGNKAADACLTCPETGCLRVKYLSVAPLKVSRLRWEDSEN